MLVYMTKMPLDLGTPPESLGTAKTIEFDETNLIVKINKKELLEFSKIYDFVNTNAIIDCYFNKTHGNAHYITVTSIEENEDIVVLHCSDLRPIPASDGYILPPEYREF